LAEEAPGTYQHSIAVATLAEAAAVAIDADPLLTKISSYFHDIGKIKRPMYFAENLATGENKHDSVTPFMSSLILMGHIRDTLDLGREYNLPERVLGIMSQHHGTTLISYFYEEAKKKEGDEVSKERFRYPAQNRKPKKLLFLCLQTLLKPRQEHCRNIHTAKWKPW
jgi:putative nucleotidyltransferase with HDIG domain